MYPKKNKSVTVELLLALIPYSRQNMALSFKPSKFFNDLDKISKYNQPTLRATYRRAKHKGLISELGGKVQLSKLANREVQPYIAQRLKPGSFLMVIFDIPEDYASARTRFRRLLLDWDFQLLQKSVWSSEMDHTEALLEVIEEFGLADYVQIYESAALYLFKK